MLIIVNKSDLLSEYQRSQWAAEFNRLGIKALFYSAHDEQEKLDREAAEHVPVSDERMDIDELNGLVGDIERQLIGEETQVHSGRSVDEERESVCDGNEDDDEPSDNEHLDDESLGNEPFDNEPLDDEPSDDEPLENEPSDDALVTEHSQGEGVEVVWGDGIATSVVAPRRLTKTPALSSSRGRVLTRKELIFILCAISSRLELNPQPRHNGRICIGLVGYPNVGKSSVINTILGVSKMSHGTVRVGVSSTPGKTKHFQTLVVNDELMLCDCPGLVFPSFMRSRGDMLCSGILPINHMKDYIEPAQIIASKVPLHLLEAAYGMRIKREIDVSDSPDRPPTPFEMLGAYCAVKGYITNGTGRWDEFRACKDMLRDFTDGVLLYVAPPNEGVDMQRWLQDTEMIMSRAERVAKRVALGRLRQQEIEEKEALENGSEMVFGGDAVDFENLSEGEDANDDQALPREHKRLKQWGKKNRRLRNKTPYADDNPTSYVAYSTNRKLEVGKALNEDKVKRRDPNKEYGTVFVGVHTLLPQKF